MVNIKVTGIDEALEKYSTKNVQLAVRQTINRAAQSGKAIASEEIRKVYNVKASDLTPRLKVYPAKMSNLEAIIEVTGRPMSLSYFNAKQITGSRVISRKGKDLVAKSSKRLKSRGPLPIGVTEQVLIGRSAFLGRAFMAKMKSGHIGVFVRKGRLLGNKIREKNVITIPSMVQNAQVMPKIRARIEERIKIELPRQLEFYMGKGK